MNIAKTTHMFCSKNINVFENTLATTVNEFVIKGSIFLKIDGFFIQERFDKLIYGINTTLKCGS